MAARPWASAEGEAVDGAAVRTLPLERPICGSRRRARDREVRVGGSGGRGRVAGMARDVEPFGLDEMLGLGAQARDLLGVADPCRESVPDQPDRGFEACDQEPDRLDQQFFGDCQQLIGYLCRGPDRMSFRQPGMQSVRFGLVRCFETRKLFIERRRIAVGTASRTDRNPRNHGEERHRRHSLPHRDSAPRVRG